MARRRRISSWSSNYIPQKWRKELIQIDSIVIKIELQNEIINDKFKTVFYCSSKAEPEGRMCVAWGRTTFKVGDKVMMTGRMIEQGVFLVWSLNYIPSTPKEEKK